MSFTEEQLMAYADDQLDAATRAMIETAMATDPVIARRVAQYRALRETLRNAYDHVLSEPVPQKLLAAARSAPSASTDETPTAPESSAHTQSPVADLAAARAARAERTQAASTRRSWSWPEWSAMAASLVIGVLATHLYTRGADTGPIANRDGRLLARGTLERALSNQLASEAPGDSPVQIGLSFRAQSGEYCRTFALASEGLSGLACREDRGWQVQVLAQSEPAVAGGGYRTASSAISPVLLQAVEQRIAGDPLDMAGEAAARERGWK